MVFWKKKKKKSNYEVNKDIIGKKELKDFLETADEEFIKIYCFPAFLACAYYFGTPKTKEAIEEIIDVQVTKERSSAEEV